MAVKKDKAVGVIVYRKEGDKIKYLIIKSENDIWGFPKGHPEAGENAKETARRELKEETGIINCALSTKFYEKTSYMYKSAEGMLDKTVYYFLGITKQTKVLLSKEHKEYMWLEYDEARKMFSFENLKELLDKAEEFLEAK